MPLPQKRLSLAAYALLISLFGLTGCQTHESFTAVPKIAHDQEPTQMGGALGVRSYGKETRVTLVTAQTTPGHIDLVVVAENYAEDPLYMGISDINALESTGDPLTLPDLNEVLYAIHRQAANRAKLLIERSQTGNGGQAVQMKPVAWLESQGVRQDLPHAHAVSFADMASGNPNASDTGLETRLKKLEEDTAQMLKDVQEAWLDEVMIVSGEYAQGLFRVNLPDATPETVRLILKAGSDIHEIEFALSSNVAAPAASTPPILASTK